ncbi:MAG: NAD(P)/FAD-dependent oxidoreductase [Caulobacteraceae bacterium]|nr:NAD(P)/FAD-dependent oxidoreductase [Caulobacteraceae bacterium]
MVVIGGGFGGLEAARALAGAPVAITLIDRQNHHTFQPLLYQVATAALSPADIAWPIRGLLGRQANVRVVMATVTGVDTQKREVLAEGITVPYDFLVVATGARPSYFGHDDWAAAAPELKRIEDATRIRQRLLLAFERAELIADPAEQKRLLTFVVVGGGPTGVELAGAIAEVAREALPRNFSRIDPRTARVVLIEAGPRLLAAFAEMLSAYARRALERMGVEVMTGAAVTGCDAGGVDLASGRIEAGTVVWAAGVRASPAADWLDAPHDGAGRVKVAPDLSVPGMPEVFVIGDTATIVGRKGRPVPGLAAAAKQMGHYVGALIAARVKGAPPPPPFRYRNFGDLATVGRNAAVVDFGTLHLTGLIGWLFWSAIHIYFLIGLRNRLVVALTWLWSYLTLQRSARLIVDP